MATGMKPWSEAQIEMKGFSECMVDVTKEVWKMFKFVTEPRTRGNDPLPTVLKTDILRCCVCERVFFSLH